MDEGNVSVIDTNGGIGESSSSFGQVCCVPFGTSFLPFEKARNNSFFTPKLLVKKQSILAVVNFNGSQSRRRIILKNRGESKAKINRVISDCLQDCLQRVERRWALPIPVTLKKS